MHLRNGLLAVLLAAALPASAQAADFKGEVSADSLEYAWEGSGSGMPATAIAAPCGSPGHDCDFVKLTVVHPGDLDLVVDFSDGGEDLDAASFPDVDAYIYKAGANGEPQGESLTGNECATSALVEKCTAKGLQPGLYVIEASFFLGADAHYKGKVTLKTAVPPTPPAGPAAPPAEQPATPPPSDPGPQPAPASQQPPPPAQPYNADEPKQPAAKKKKSKKSKKAKRAACNKKAKKIKNKSKRRKALKRCARRYR